MDIYDTVTKDDTTTVNKVLFRVKIPFTISGQEIVLNTSIYKFDGDSTTYSSGGVTPPLSEGVLGNVIDLNTFLTAAGDAQENS